MNIGTKAIVFTDLHFGIHSNSQPYINVCKETMSWIKDIVSCRGIKDVIFMGDFFDSRASIDVKTLNQATESLYDLADSVNNIVMILGNHDIYLRDSTSIHSLFAFTGHNSITVIDKPTFVNDIALLPWNFGCTNGETIDVKPNMKYVFCHHNFPSDFFMFGNKKKKIKSDTYSEGNKYECEFGIQNNIVETVIKNNGIIFSGHIHKRTEIPLTNNKNTKIIIEGSPYETSWGWEFDETECGVYIIDFLNCEYEFISNPFNKKHVELHTSRFDKDLTYCNIENAIVRLVVDTHESFDAVSRMQSIIKQRNPFIIESTKYEFADSDFSIKNSNEDVKKTSNTDGYTSIDYINNAIDNTDFSRFSYFDGIKQIQVDKCNLKSIAIKLYEGISL